MCKVYGGRMCDVDGCSSMDNLTHYSYDVDLCIYHKYLAKRMGVQKEELKENDECIQEANRKLGKI